MITTHFKDEWSFLNEYQTAAVYDNSPACVVNANVGSGKTTVLIAKILYLYFECNIPLEDMVVLTFTNKAADEIIDRLLKKEPVLTGEQVEGFGTFHSVAMSLLKNKLPVEQAGWTKEFTVVDPEEEIELAMKLIAAHKLKVKYKNRLKKRLEQEYLAFMQGKEHGRYKDDLFKLYPLLEEEKKRQNKMSFSDLLRVSTKLLRTSCEMHPKWIIVDEVQDSDALQIDFLEALKGKDTRLFAVGDPNQVIYSWRGTGQNMFYLLKHKFEAKELALPVNYRSNASILEAANKFLQFGTAIQGSREAGQKIVVKNHYDPFQEAEYLADRIRELHEEGKAYGDIAIFYRLKKQSEILEKVFTRNEIPFVVFAKKETEEEKGEYVDVADLRGRRSIGNAPEGDAAGNDANSKANQTSEDVVKLMTLHASKGLEFDTVFLIGMNQGLIPLCSQSYEEKEEERRLFFVGITRAKNELELSYYTNPGEPRALSTYSRYLRMLPAHLLDWKEVRSEQQKTDNLQQLRKQVQEQMRKVDREQMQKPVVKHANHPKYGVGVLVAEDEMMVEVEFPGYGRKQFLKAFGEVEII